MNKKIAILITILIIFIVLIIFIYSYLISINTENNEEIVYKNNISSENLIENEKESEIMKMYLKVNNKILVASLENNTSVDALIEKLKQNDITINMSDYGNFEKVGPLGFNLPRNDKQITTEPGDIILYQGNSITIYYDTNNWTFTKIGKIENINQKELKEILGNGNVTITLSLNK